MTQTYSILEVAPATFADVCTRLNEAGVACHYLRNQGELIVLGAIALKIAPTKSKESPGELPLKETPRVELIDVPVYDSAALDDRMRGVLRSSPWERIEHGRCGNFMDEAAGILVGYAVVAADLGLAQAVKAKGMQQAYAEIINLILLCGGKIPASAYCAKKEEGQ